MNTITMSGVIVTLFLGGPQPLRDRRLDDRHPARSSNRSRGHRLVRPQAVRVPLHLRVVPGDAAPAALRPADGPRLEAADPGRARLVPAARRDPASARDRRLERLCDRGRCHRAGWCSASAGLLFDAGAQGQRAATANEKGRCSDGLPRRIPASRCSQHRLFGGKRVTTEYSGGRGRQEGQATDPDVGRRREDRQARAPARPPRLNRYEDGMEKCIGCELCAGVCPAKCIYVRGADNDPDEPDVAGRALRVRLRDQLPALHPLRPVRRGVPDRGDHRVEAVRVLASPTAATRSTPRTSCSSTTTASRKQLPWEDWREGEDELHQRLDARHVAVRRRRLRRRGRLERRARLRRACRRAAAGRTRERRRWSCSSSSSRRRWCSAARSAWSSRVASRCTPRSASSSRCSASPCMFVAQEAHFLAAVQVIVYAGAIVVLFLFVIMLLGVDKAEDLRIEPFPIQRPLAAVVGVGLVGLIVAAIVVDPRHRRCVGHRAASRPTADDRSTHDANIRQLAAQPVQRPRVRVRAHVGAAGRRRRRHRAAGPPRPRKRRATADGRAPS